MPRRDETLAARVKMCRKALQMTQAELAAASGLKQPDISKIELGLIEKTTGIARLAEALKVSARWLETGDGQPSADSQSDPAKSFLAHPLSLSEITVPSTISWEEVQAMTEVPQRFTINMPDDSLSGHIDRGTGLIFERSLAPSPGKTVLIQDNDGNRFVRIYATVRGTHWQALAKSPVYVTLDSEQHGLSVLATMKWREG